MYMVFGRIMWVSFTLGSVSVINWWFYLTKLSW